MSSTNPQALFPFLPDNAPFSPDQRAYLNGLLAGMFSSSPAMSDFAEDSAPARPLTILFGSQTGNAESVAKQAAKKANVQGFQTTVFDMEAYPKENLAAEQNLLIITSTYGEGEPPDNAMELHAFLLSDAAPKLENVHFSVLGLGDSNYPDFNECAKQFDVRLAELGAQRMHDGVYCDVDFDDDFEAWLTGTLAAAGDVTATTSSATQSQTVAPVAVEAPAGHSRKNPFPAKLLSNYNLNKVGSAKETRHVEICLEGSGLEYEAGDALGVFPVNCTDLVEELLALTGFDGEEAVPGMDGAEVALRLALAEHYDITNLSKLFLANLAPFSNHEKLNKLLADGNGNIDEYIKGRQIIDPLVDFPGKWSSAAEFIDMFKKLAPRLYSISSSPKAHPGHVHLTVGAVRYETHGRSRKGVCSTFLADLPAGTPVRVYVHPNKHFKPPADPNRPMIMVGPGTGIAPFRAFLEERHAVDAPGKNWLFFGDQKSAFDFLYEDQLNELKEAEKLHRLDLAFSRDSAEKFYVQHLMIQQGEELFTWLEEGGHFYVCGDASRMAKDVDAALHEIVKTVGRKTEEEAAAYIDDLRKQKRYVRDVY
ncbi:sulfite reductase subunit alpha [Cerasicoccus arenae]|uniref:assimilatory sulfite reductase (NADPH) n=1 Tax=Cerasicoccus arenae TaxID=424488 RepID=A0A8J3DD83_9BACT|nr:sulfite reductase subunit alpha [Cerasicoccus arenae]MBK1859722.1 sulfite reductase subunit alpha [Cerasicoccus arenae]GHC05983.1 sulfite reductase [NADPH] flavoprotein alpha-component [Cerasicoccus arenae]